MIMSYSLKWIRYNITVLLFFIIITNCLLDSGYENKELLKIVKRNLLCREKEYLKTKPLSDNLKNFIKRIKREAKHKKNKNSIRNNMYVLRGGEVIPLKQLNILDTVESKRESNVLQGQFTVVPLIVPKENATEECIETEPETICMVVTANTTTSTTTKRTTTKTTLLAIEKVTDEYDLVPVEASTKGELLGKVIKDVQELITFEKKSRPTGEASLCNITGDWDSSSGGLQFRISTGFESYTRMPKVDLEQLEPARDGFLSESTWNATGLSPFANSSLISLTLVSTSSKKVAMFLGECRICEGSESISGHWMIRRRSKNCKDREEANSFFSDVLRKNNVRKLQHEHLDEITTESVLL